MSRFIAQLRVAFLHCIHAWESLQIELRGQYSLRRLDELLVFTRQTSVLCAIAIPVLTPVICAATIIVPDVLPLRPPIGGITNQSATYWVRSYLTSTVISAVMILQFFHASPRLRMSKMQFAVATAFVGTGSALVVFAFNFLIGFPTPFSFQIAAFPGHILLDGTMWFMWKTQIRDDPEVRRDLVQFLWVLMIQCATTVAYPVIIFIFGKLSGFQQTVSSIGFPVLKLLLKNLVNHCFYRLEDLAPVFIVLSVDVFHALLLSCAMQSAASRGTLISVMATDVFQSVVAVVEVWRILQRLRLELLTAGVAHVLQPSHPRVQDSILTIANSILSSHPDIRSQPAIALPRHLRQRPSLSSQGSSNKIAPENHKGGLAAADHTLERNKQPSTVESVRLTLKLLHMVEYYVLIEFVEVIVAVIYAVYLIAMFHLPNRIYYSSLKSLTHDDLTETVGYVLEYAALELLSLVVLIGVLDRLLGMSTLRLLAFTLRKHALLAQSLLVLWVFLATQFTLEHFGVDFTFRFEWLRHADHHNKTTRSDPSSTT